MIDVEQVMRCVPHFDTFCSIEKLHGLVESVHKERGFEVRVAGHSTNNVPIHHVRFGRGPVKALIVGFSDCMEPIGGMTVFSLLSLLKQGHSSLVNAGVEWNFVPCVDPDGALLNEGWTQKPFSLENFMKNYHLRGTRQQVDTSFPIAHKKLLWREPSVEAKVLQGVLESVLPDFYFPLHNARTGGAFYFISQDIGLDWYKKIYHLLEQHRFPLQRRPIWSSVCKQFADGVIEMFSVRKYYDYLEQTTSSPEERLPFGAGSWDYLAEIKSNALSFVAELGYLEHPDENSGRTTGQNLRQFKLHVDADSRFLASLITAEWEELKSQLDPSNPFYQSITGGTVFPAKEAVCEGGFPLSRFPSRDVLFNPQYDRMMTEGDRFAACMVDGGFMFLHLAYQFVRLLKTSRQTPQVLTSIDRLERAFEDSLATIRRHIDFSRFNVFDCDTLVKVQLGSGLIVLNSILAKSGRAEIGGVEPQGMEVVRAG